MASGLVAPFVGRLADRYGARWLIPSGTLILGVCLFSFIWIHSVWQFFVIAIFARAISQPLLIGIVPRTVAVNFFRRRRNLALALTGMFRPISGTINIQLFALAALAIVPIGDNFTMGPDDALKAVKLIEPRRVIPDHYNTWPPIAQDAAAWAERVRAETSAEPLVMRPGESCELG